MLIVPLSLLVFFPLLFSSLISFIGHLRKIFVQEEKTKTITTTTLELGHKISSLFDLLILTAKEFTFDEILKCRVIGFFSNFVHAEEGFVDVALNLQACLKNV